MKGNTGTRTFDRTVLGYQSQHMRNVCAPSASPSNDTKVIISMFIFLRGVFPPENMYVYEGGRSAFRGSLQDVGCAETMHSPTDQRIEERLKHEFVGMWFAHPSPKQDELVSMRAGIPTYKRQDAWSQMYRSASTHSGAGSQLRT
jgi:hypothetical protein